MILLRHGQSEFNVVYGETRVDPGIRDPRLTELGRQQARAAAKSLHMQNVVRLISSPYTRALETAHEIADVLGLPITVEAIVRERRAFVCDFGTPRSALGRRWPHLELDHLEEQWWHDDEESEADVTQRCHRFRDRMRRVEDWPRVAVITHWGFILALTGLRLRNGESVQFDPTTGCGGVTEVAPPRDP